jgi:hypothetical protein
VKRIEGEDDLGDGVRIGVGMALPGLGHRHRTLHQPHRSLGLRRLQVTSTANMAAAVLFLHLSLDCLPSFYGDHCGSWFLYFICFPPNEGGVCRGTFRSGPDRPGPDEPGSISGMARVSNKSSALNPRTRELIYSLIGKSCTRDTSKALCFADQNIRSADLII